MKKFIIFVIFIVLVVGATLIFDKGIMKNKSKNSDELVSDNIDGPARKMAAAGSFYP